MILQIIKSSEYPYLVCDMNIDQERLYDIFVWCNETFGVDEWVTTKYLDRQLSMEERLKHTGASRLLLHADELVFEYKNIEYRVKSSMNFLDEILQSVSRETDQV